jgi:hypothetical protein
VRALSLVSSIAKNRTGGVPKPSWCTYLVCYRCNARCGMCDSWRLKPGRELTVEQVALVFAKIGRLDVVRLTGGEPFLRTDMLEIAETILRVSRPSVIHVTTNGSKPDSVEALARAFSAPRRLQFMCRWTAWRRCTIEVAGPTHPSNPPWTPSVVWSWSAAPVASPWLSTTP